jgi:hydroxyacylglutathione hydrolase
MKKRDDFIRHMSEGLPDRPANIARIVAINQGTLPLTLEAPEARPVPPAEASRWMEEDPAIRTIDMREPAGFGEAHVPGAGNLPISSAEFEQRAGWVFDPDTPFLLLGENDRDARRASHKLAFVGLDSNVRGFIPGGMPAWRDAGLPSASLDQISVEGLHEHLRGDAGNGWNIVDVREDEEWTEGHIEGAHHMNFKKMGKADLDLPFPRGETLAVICGGGIRSSTGASLLQGHGYSGVINVVGGMSAWRAADYEVATEN